MAGQLMQGVTVLLIDSFGSFHRFFKIGVKYADDKPIGGFTYENFICFMKPKARGNLSRNSERQAIADSSDFSRVHDR